MEMQGYPFTDLQFATNGAQSNSAWGDVEGVGEFLEGLSATIQASDAYRQNSAGARLDSALGAAVVFITMCVHSFTSTSAPKEWSHPVAQAVTVVIP
jgi:hypothetical protein